MNLTIPPSPFFFFFFCLTIGITNLCFIVRANQMNYLSPSSWIRPIQRSQADCFSLRLSLGGPDRTNNRMRDECTLESHTEDQMAFVSESHLVPESPPPSLPLSLPLFSSYPLSSLTPPFNYPWTFAAHDPSSSRFFPSFTRRVLRRYSPKFDFHPILPPPPKLGPQLTSPKMD